MRKLPGNLPKDQMESVWASQIEPVIGRAQNNSNILQNVALAAGTNVINHKLGRKLQGWKPTRLRSSAIVYDQQDSNPTPQLTLILVSSADVIADIEVF
jgi:hypothetical protein